jgi:hypothetical protein
VPAAVYSIYAFREDIPIADPPMGEVGALICSAWARLNPLFISSDREGTKPLSELLCANPYRVRALAIKPCGGYIQAKGL